MSKKKSPIIIPEGHRLPTTRRDFLKYGIIPFAGTVLVPSVVTQLLYASRARADEGCQDAGGGEAIPFLVFDMAGGGALPGNFLVGKTGGPKDFLDKYETLGWNPRGGSDPLDESFGVP